MHIIYEWEKRMSEFSTIVFLGALMFLVLGLVAIAIEELLKIGEDNEQR